MVLLKVILPACKPVLIIASAVKVTALVKVILPPLPVVWIVPCRFKTPLRLAPNVIFPVVVSALAVMVVALSESMAIVPVLVFKAPARVIAPVWLIDRFPDTVMAPPVLLNPAPVLLKTVKSVVLPTALESLTLPVPAVKVNW